MQIMSSPSMSDAADTPLSGSGGSPSPQSPASTSKHILDFSKRDFADSDSNITNGLSSKNLEATPTGSERSMNSSPAILVPTPRSTPPMNGILTPPNDAEGNIDGLKQGKSGGRLKFFKDGVLCLELSHNGEGERTKWVQIRSKTVFPTLVHAVKEATIPCHSTPSSFASPSSLTHTHRVESSTSHSLSDDACSMLSSPRARENHWKQPVPQRGVSSSLQFFMKPAPCALKLRGKMKELFHSQEQIRKRWPYNCRGTDIFVKLKNSVQCCCDEQSRVLTDSSSSSSANVNSVNKISSDENENVKTVHGTVDEPNETKAIIPKKTPLHKVIEHLEKVAVATSQHKIAKEAKSYRTSDLNDSSKRSTSTKPSAITPKKRLFNEVESKECGNVRPKKKSPNRTQEKGKTILNIPGLNSEFYKRHSAPVSVPSISPLDMLEVRSGKSSVNKRNNQSPHFGAKSTSTGSSVLKPGLTGELVNRYSPLSGRNSSGRIPSEHTLPRQTTLPNNLQEQQYIQQQTVSKAISYTINSLLGTGSGSGGAGDSSASMSARRIEHKDNKLTKEALSGHIPPPYQKQRERNNMHSPSIRNTNSQRPEQDQKSFLRHLLDTSDPIPSVKSVDRTSKNMPRSIPVNHNNNNNNSKSNSVLKTVKASNHYHDTMTSSPSTMPKNITKGNSSSPHSSSSGMHGFKGSGSESNPSISSNIALSSLMSSFPLGLASQYDFLARGANANPHSTEALTAAAFALQYGSLIPGNIFPPANSTMAAAAMASYFSMMPQMANLAVPPATPPLSSHSPSPPAKANLRRSQEPVHSNHRSSWQGQTVANGHSPVSSPPFRNATPLNSQNSPVRTSSAISTVEIPTSCGALNLSAKKKNKIDETADIDAPLDLCKKPSR